VETNSEQLSAEFGHFDVFDLLVLILTHSLFIIGSQHLKALNNHFQVMCNDICQS